MPLHQRANPAHDKQTPEKKLNMRAMTSQCETSGKNHIFISVKSLKPSRA